MKVTIDAWPERWEEAARIATSFHLKFPTHPGVPEGCGATFEVFQGGVTVWRFLLWGCPKHWYVRQIR